MAKAASKTIQVKLVRSPIGYNKTQKATVRALGLTKLHQVVEKEDSPAIRGMINRVSHLVEVSEN
jgi:large subunit ribosomal protein L30